MKFEGLLPVIVQEKNTRDVLMLAYMNQEAYEKTLETGDLYFFSRSRQALWKKGETSGNTQKLISLSKDCDQDTLLAIVEQKGVACHTGNYTCFYQDIIGEKEENIIRKLDQIIKDRQDNPVEGSYTNYLLTKGRDKILKKIGEEASEVIIASKNVDKDEIIYEVSDLIYHSLVLLNYEGISLNEIMKELENRFK